MDGAEETLETVNPVAVGVPVAGGVPLGVGVGVDVGVDSGVALLDRLVLPVADAVREAVGDADTVVLLEVVVLGEKVAVPVEGVSVVDGVRVALRVELSVCPTP